MFVAGFAQFTTHSVTHIAGIGNPVEESRELIALQVIIRKVLIRPGAFTGTAPHGATDSRSVANPAVFVYLTTIFPVPRKAAVFFDDPSRYLGSSQDARNGDLLRSLGVRYVVIAAEECHPVFSEVHEFYTFGGYEDQM